MIKTVYSVRDVKSGFGPLMMFDNDAVAMRSFSISVKQPDALMHWTAADFSLYAVGTFCDDSGRIEPFDVPTHICDAVDFVKE